MKRNVILNIKNLEKHYNSGFSLGKINLEIEEGMIVGLIGLNGSGKTTLLSCIADPEVRDGGEVYFHGQKLDCESYSMLQNIGIVKSEQNFPDDFTPESISKIMSKIYKNWDTHVFYHILKNLEVNQNGKIKNFSTGMKSKLSIAMTLSHQAQILILDEPTNGLDIVSREKVRNCLFDFVQDGHKIILISSHILGDIEKISDRILIMNKGKIILDNSKDDLLQSYGVYKVTSKQFDKIDKTFIVKSKNKEMHISILVKHIYEFERKYNIFNGNFTIEDIVELFLEEE